MNQKYHPNRLLTTRLSELSRAQKTGCMIGFILLGLAFLFSGFIYAGSWIDMGLLPFLCFLLGLWCLLYAIFLTTTLIQPRKAVRQTFVPKKTDLPAPSPDSPVHPQYQRLLALIEMNKEDVMKKRASVEDMIDNCFEGSPITRERYLEVIDNAICVLDDNFDKAREAAIAFGESEPTPRRIEMLTMYASETNDITRGIDNVVDGLAQLMQDQTVKTNDGMDERLDELARTTSLYNR